jgi:drug/metabolite transporter (DMT)-like permease
MVYYAHESSYHVALMFDTYGGGLAALTAAFLWAIASLVYRRAGKQIPPLELNLLKGVVALALLALTLLLTGVSLAGVQPLALGLMLLGGALGIGVGDTAYFESLNSLGARRALLLGILAPPIAALLALLLLGETLSAPAWAGILLTVLGVAWVVTERAPETVAVRAHLGRGLGFGLLSALAQAGGMVLSRAAFVRADISPLYGACLRLAAGIVTLLLWLALTRRPAGRWLRAGQPGRLWAWLLFAIFAGTYLAIWLQQIALKLTSAGMTQTLFSTSPLFILPFAAWMGEKVSARAIGGALLALAGVALLFG